MEKADTFSLARESWVMAGVIIPLVKMANRPTGQVKGFVEWLFSVSMRYNFFL